MSETLQSWVEQAVAIPGVLAVGARGPDHSVLARSSYDEFSAAKIEEVLREIAETFRLLEQNRMAAARLRWTLEIGWLHAFVFSDGTLIALLITKGAGSSPELERLLGSLAPQ